MVKKMKAIDWIAIVLLIVGGINWGFVAWFNLDLVQAILGSYPTIVKLIYTTVAVAGIYSLWFVIKKIRR